VAVEHLEAAVPFTINHGLVVTIAELDLSNMSAGVVESSWQEVSRADWTIRCELFRANVARDVRRSIVSRKQEGGFDDKR
jgi:hypothetical protein